MTQNIQEKNLERRTDTEVAIFWTNHIENPCDLNLGFDDGLRKRYIGEAKKALASFSNPYAIEALERTIKRYSN